jgi:hypothetical protein
MPLEPVDSLDYPPALSEWWRVSWRITITFPDMVGDEGNNLLHRVRNFGETLFVHFREHGRGSISLEEVDRATNTLVVEGVRNRDLRRTVQGIRQMAEVEFPERTPEIIAERDAAA